LIITTKYRKKVINDDICLFLKNKFEDIGRKYMIELEEFNHDQDHVHILFRTHPNTDISKFINAYKSASSRLVKKYYPEVMKQLGKEMFWTRSYCLLTSGGVTTEIVRKYIEKQGSK
jgi:putative transposase